jgi:leucyl-tRNA synthetase
MINGKLRAKQLFSLDIHNSEIEKSILENENVKKWVKKSDIKKIIIVPNKIINIVS